MTGVHLPKNARARGFTLVEMLVVIGIIAVVSATALPNLVGFMRGSKIRAAQNDVASALQKARSAAIMKNTQMGITFVVQNPGASGRADTYYIHTEDTIAGTETVGQFVGLTRQPVNFTTPVNFLTTRYTLPFGVEFATGPNCPVIAGFAPNQASVRFDRYGQPQLPGVGTNPALGLVGGTTVNRIYVPAGTADYLICLWDRNTNLRRALQISRSGRILRP